MKSCFNLVLIHLQRQARGQFPTRHMAAKEARTNQALWERKKVVKKKKSHYVLLVLVCYIHTSSLVWGNLQGPYKIKFASTWNGLPYRETSTVSNCTGLSPVLKREGPVLDCWAHHWTIIWKGYGLVKGEEGDRKFPPIESLQGIFMFPQSGVELIV